MAFDPITGAFEFGTSICKALEAAFLMERARYEKMKPEQVQQEAQNRLDFWQPMLDGLRDVGALMRKALKDTTP